jgi:hypothetical protein
MLPKVSQYNETSAFPGKLPNPRAQWLTGAQMFVQFRIIADRFTFLSEHSQQ